VDREIRVATIDDVGLPCWLYLYMDANDDVEATSWLDLATEFPRSGEARRLLKRGGLGPVGWEPVDLADEMPEHALEHESRR
jgi:hypothetical protein